MHETSGNMPHSNIVLQLTGLAPRQLVVRTVAERSVPLAPHPTSLSLSVSRWNFQHLVNIAQNQLVVY